MKSQKDYTNHKGFTLVELIVVIVILAILAAILIPGLLKWIDHAKKKQYELEARNIYLATEASLAQLHGVGFENVNEGNPKDLTHLPNNYFTLIKDIKNETWLAYIEKMSGTDEITYLKCYIDYGKLKALAIEYKSPSDGKPIQATIKKKGYTLPSDQNDGKPESMMWLDDGTWHIEVQ